MGVCSKCRERQLTEQVVLFGHLGNIVSNFLPSRLLAVHSPWRGPSTELRGCVPLFLHISVDSHTVTLVTKKKGVTCWRGCAASRQRSWKAPRFRESQGDKVKNERRSYSFVEPEWEEVVERSSPAAGGSEDSKYHKSCTGGAADALWISRTPGNPNSGQLCTRRATAEISISVCFALMRTRSINKNANTHLRCV